MSIFGVRKKIKKNLKSILGIDSVSSSTVPSWDPPMPPPQAEPEVRPEESSTSSQMSVTPAARQAGEADNFCLGQG